MRALWDRLRAWFRPAGLYARFARAWASWALLALWGFLPRWLQAGLTWTLGLPITLWVWYPRWGRLADYYIGVALIWYYLHNHPPTSGLRDAYLLFGIGVIYTLVWAIMIVGTKVWTGRGIGLLGTANGDGLIYIAVSSAALAAIPDLPPETINAARANFYLGGGVLLVMVLRWLIQTRAGTREFPVYEDELTWRDDLIEEQRLRINELEDLLSIATHLPPV